MVAKRVLCRVAQRDVKTVVKMVQKMETDLVVMKADMMAK
jgi:hypothetical protein